MKDVTFHNVKITVSAASPEEAYSMLCELLAGSDCVEYDTDTFTVQGETEMRSTEELFPED